jgi:hypothetical protein
MSGKVGKVQQLETFARNCSPLGPLLKRNRIY